ncbi:MAG: nitrate/nitrite transporter [Asticcacaulis sp. 32-58-5]|nr:MAG: nitrate/nitrite transporter [Asticcacaulis sp. 32-58-5]
MANHLLTDWEPEAPDYWASKGRGIAARNLWVSVPNLTLAFAVWMVWSMVVAKLKLIGFQFTTDQLFWLTALPALSGATLRIFYSFIVPILGGRLWTVLTTLSLAIPAVGIGIAVQHPETPYTAFVILALLCGFGGGNFASSMSNIGFFFPKAQKGNALAINAGFGNLGVSLMQFVVPIIITSGLFAPVFGAGQPTQGNGVESELYLQNAAFIWVPFIFGAAFAAWVGMNDISTAKASFKTQSVVFRRMHNWIMCWLYLGTFGSFIGFSAAFPLLAKTLFPDVNVLQLAFLGPLVGAASRALTGWISDRWGGQNVTQITFGALILGVLFALLGVGAFGGSADFKIFFASFMWLFFWTGVGNASTFQMIPAIVRASMPRLMPTATASEQLKSAEMESAAIVGFTSAFGAFGGVFIPMALGQSLKATGNANTAFVSFLAFYLTCAILNWIFYSRKDSILRGAKPNITLKVTE